MGLAAFMSPAPSTGGGEGERGTGRLGKIGFHVCSHPLARGTGKALSPPPLGRHHHHKLLGNSILHGNVGMPWPGRDPCPLPCLPGPLLMLTGP